MNGKVLAMLLLVSFIVLSESWGRRRRGARRRRVWHKIAKAAKKVVHFVKKAIPHIKKVVKVATAVLPLFGVGDEDQVFETIAYLKSLQEQDLDQFNEAMKNVEGEMVATFGQDEAEENMKMLSDLVETSESELMSLMDGEDFLDDDLMAKM